MSSKLSTLAIEVVETITALLDPTDLRSLRLVCRALNEKTLRDFGLADFATVHTDLSRKSLQRLRDISESSHLAFYVQHLHIKYADDDGKLGRGLDWCRHPSGCLAEEPPNSGGATLLRDILAQKLLQCRSFHIHSYDEYQPPHETDCLIPSDAAGIILSIVAKAGLALRAFTIQSSHDGNGRLDTPRLQMPLSQTPEFVAAWSHIEELVLDYAMTVDQGAWVIHLIASAPRLRKLSLGIYEAEISFTTLLASLHALNRLEELSLGSANVTVENFSTFLLNNCQTLRSLTLRHVSLANGGTWATVLENMKGQIPHLQYLLLFHLKQETDNRRVIFSKMTRYPVVPEPEDPGPDKRLRFDRRRIESVSEPITLRYWGGGRRVAGVMYHGMGIDHVLRALADTVETM
ncbi:MAG: hypothetical protein Q9207_008421 [Kuettlingeria erythrocarpa]